MAYAAVGNEGLKRIAGTLKWVVTSILTVVLLVFVGYLTVSGVIAGSTDAVTVKAAKFTMSSLVPVVGGILSDAAETVLAGAGILKNAVGVFGMLAVLCMCVAPFLQLGIHYLTYKVTSALSATVSSGRVAGLIDQIGGGSYFDSARLNRQQARDSALAILQDSIANESADETMKEANGEAIQTLASYTVSEAQIENLVTAKGYTDCVAFIGDESVSVVVSAREGGLTDADVAKITEIVTDETGMEASQVKIIEAEG